jgi:phosphinothricin acetyltransferase
VGQFESRVVKVLQSHPWLVCTNQDRVIGYAYAGPHRSRDAYKWSTEVSVYVHSQFQRKRIANALYTALINVLKLQGFYTALAGITLPNDTSVRFHETFGFAPVGIYNNVGYKFHKWYSVGWWELPLQPYDSPIEPLSLDPVMVSPEWTKIMKTSVTEIRSIRNL